MDLKIEFLSDFTSFCHSISVLENIKISTNPNANITVMVRTFMFISQLINQQVEILPMKSKLKFSILKQSVLVSLTLIILSCGSDPKPFVPVVGDSEFVLFINELNAGGNPSDWIEIYNPGTEMVQLEGFYLFDDNTDKYKIPPGFIVPAGGYILFYCDELATGDHTNFRLTSGGELVALEDPSGNVVDFVEFPSVRGGQAYGRFPDGSSSMFITGIQTPDESNGASPGPVLQRLNRDIAVPTQEQTVTVNVEGFHQNGQITDMQLFYRLNGDDYDSLAMTLTGDSTYAGAIPPSEMDAVVNYYICAKDQNGLKTFRPAGAPDSVDIYVINSEPLPQLFINEFLAVNDACCPDTDGGVEEFNDWIEIYNPGNDAIDIGGFHLSDNSIDPFKHMIPDNQPAMTTIQAGGYLLIWADGDIDQGPLHTNFRLSSEGETVGLYSPDGRIVDEYEFGIQESDVSMGRSPNGSDNWVKFTVPTPGVSN